MDYFKFLPLEITIDILTRLPTESALECKTVCTNWRSVVGHPSFSKMHCHHHLNHPSSESAIKLGFLVSTCDNRLHFFEYDENHDQTKTPNQRITRISFTFPVKYRSFKFVGSINGLICLLDYKRPPSFYIYNPITRECVTLPQIKRDDDFKRENTSFGYVSLTNEYKVVRFCKSETHLEVHIYTLGSGDGWRNLGKFNDGSSSLYSERSVFFANETLYWLEDELEMIGTFDMAEEKFGEHLAPPPFPPDYDWFYYNNIGVMDGFLFFVHEDEGDDGFRDIWLFEKKNPDKEGGEEHPSLGWNKTIRIGDMVSKDLLGVTKRGGVLSDSGHLDINIYDTKTSTSKSLVRFNGYIFDVIPHKNTLVSLKELGEEDAKVMESAEIEETESDEQSQEDESSVQSQEDESDEQSQEDSEPEDVHL